MEKIDKYVIYKNTIYYRLTDLTGALGLVGRTYGFNMAIENVGGKIVKVPGFGNSYFLSDADAKKVDEYLSMQNQDGGERVDASTGQTVQKVKPNEVANNSQTDMIPEQNNNITNSNTTNSGSNIQ